MRPPTGEPPQKPGAANDAFNDLAALVLDYLGEDDPRRSENELLARMIWSGLHGYVSLVQARRPGRRSESVAYLVQHS